MKAVIMAGGEGTRLRPLTAKAPKPLLPVCNVPIMEHVIDHLKSHGVTEVVVTVSYMASAIRSYFGDGSELGVSLVYATEEMPMGTAGSVGNAREELNDTFLVISGDVITDINLSEVMDFHIQKGGLATVALKKVENPLEFGIVITDENGSIEKFLEKPTWGQVFSDTINTGIYVLEPEIFEFIEVGAQCDFASDVFPKCLSVGEKLYGIVANGYWEDVGTLEAFLRTQVDLLSGQANFKKRGVEISPGITVGEGVEIDPTAEIDPPCVIGDNTKIGPNVKIRRNCSIGSNVRIQANAEIARSVLFDNDFIASSSVVEGAIVGKGCDIREGAKLSEGVVIGDDCSIGAHAEIGHSVKIYPNKIVEPGAIVNSSIIWESRASKNIFGRNGFEGLANVDVTPELAMKVAMSYASLLKPGTTVVASRDSSRIARMLKRSLMVGFNASGINVQDLEVAPIPITRFAQRMLGCNAGFTVRLKPGEPDSVVVRFFNENGSDLIESEQRKIERAYYREEFRRAVGAEIGDIDFPPRIAEAYTSDLLTRIDQNSIKSRRYKLVLDYCYGSTSFVMPNVLAKLGAEVIVQNPYGATSKAMNVNRFEQAQEVSRLVSASNADLGAVLDPDGELLVTVDSAGKILSDDEILIVYCILLANTYAKTGAKRHIKVALPVSAPSCASKILTNAGIEVIEAKLSPGSLVESGLSEKVELIASTWGGFGVPKISAAFDSIASLTYLLELLATAETNLSDVRAEIPSFAICHNEIDTPWSIKGAVMREVVSEISVAAEKVQMIDGVKAIYDNHWVLILPDPDRPVTHCFVETEDPNMCETISKRYSEMLSNLIGSLKDNSSDSSRMY